MVLLVAFFPFCREQPVTNSAIHKATSSLATGCSQNAVSRNAFQRLFLPAAPIHRLWDILQWNGRIVELYQSNYETARNHEASGFVNSTVRSWWLCELHFKEHKVTDLRCQGPGPPQPQVLRAQN